MRPYNGSRFCVDAYGESDHGYHIIRTNARGGSYCSSYLNRDPGLIRQRAEWFADGRYCAYLSEQQNSTTTPQLQTVINQDVWYLGCNNGAGVNVYISMDTWNWANYDGYWYPNYGGLRAANITGHCHCP